MNEFRRAARQKLFSCAVAVLFNFQSAAPDRHNSSLRACMVRFVVGGCPAPRALSPGLDNSTGNSTATRQATRQVARQLLDRPRQNTPDSMRRRRQVSTSSTARQLDRPHQNSTDLDRAEPIRTSLLEPHSFKVKVDGDPLVNYTTWWLDDGFTSGGPFVSRSVCSFVLFLN